MMDAMGCQKTIAQAIWDQGADYVLALKQNLSQQHEDVEDMCVYEESTGFTDDVPDIHKTTERGHGRQATRRCTVITEPAYLAYVNHDRAWPDRPRLVRGEAERTPDDHTTHETRDYISSLLAEAQTLFRTIRGHGNIENSLPWILDMAFQEDDNRSRTGYTPRTWLSCGACFTQNPPPKGGSRTSANGPGGTGTTCAKCGQPKMRLPCPG